MRTIIDLKDEQIKELAIICQQTKLSRAEVIRRAVAEYLLQNSRKKSDLAFGLWGQHEENGLKYQERLRKEWDR